MTSLSQRVLSTEEENFIVVFDFWEQNGGCEGRETAGEVAEVGARI